MYHAVHLISESGDHYNMLIDADTDQEFVDKIKKECNDFAYISQAFIATGVDTQASADARTKVLLDAIEEAYNNEDQE